MTTIILSVLLVAASIAWLHSRARVATLKRERDNYESDAQLFRGRVAQLQTEDQERRWQEAARIRMEIAQMEAKRAASRPTEGPKPTPTRASPASVRASLHRSTEPAAPVIPETAPDMSWLTLAALSSGDSTPAPTPVHHAYSGHGGHSGGGGASASWDSTPSHTSSDSHSSHSDSSSHSHHDTSSSYSSDSSSYDSGSTSSSGDY